MKPAARTGRTTGRSPFHHKPSKKPALSTRGAIGGTVVLIAFMMMARGAFGMEVGVVAMVALAVAALVRFVLGARKPTPPRGRVLEVRGHFLVQHDGDDEAVTIDLREPFEYEILDRYDVMDSSFQLHQGATMLAFYNSDPGGKEAVSEVLQIEWPPPTRGPSRSLKPPSY